MSIRTQFTPAFGNVSMNRHPIELSRCIVTNKTREPIEDGNRCVTTIETVTDGGTGRGIHSSCWGTDVHDCNAQLFVFGEGNVEGGGRDGSALIGVKVFLELRVTKFHCTMEIFPTDRFSDF